MPSVEEIKTVMDEVDALDLPDGAHWCLINERLGMEPGDVESIIAENPEAYGFTSGT